MTLVLVSFDPGADIGGVIAPDAADLDEGNTMVGGLLGEAIDLGGRNPKERGDLLHGHEVIGGRRVHRYSRISFLILYNVRGFGFVLQFRKRLSVPIEQFMQAAAAAKVMFRLLRISLRFPLKSL
jgi:hypothetical protein